MSDDEGRLSVAVIGIPGDPTLVLYAEGMDEGSVLEAVRGNLGASGRPRELIALQTTFAHIARLRDRVLPLN